MENLAPYEAEFRRFDELSCMSDKPDFKRAFDIFWDSPGVVFWMNSTDIAWNVAEAIKEGLDIDKALSLYDSGKEFSNNLDRIAQLNNLGLLVEKCAFADDDKDGTTYWRQYNEFLTQVKAGDIRKVPANTFVYGYIPIGVSARVYTLLKGREQSNFERLVRESMDRAREIILLDALLGAAFNWNERNRELPPDLWDL